jgi:hypothetical protein
VTRIDTAKKFGHRVADVFALVTSGMQTLRCPVGCGHMVRYRAVSAAEEKQLTAVAADHDGRHQFRTI